MKLVRMQEKTRTKMTKVRKEQDGGFIWRHLIRNALLFRCVMYIINNNTTTSAMRMERIYGC